MVNNLWNVLEIINGWKHGGQMALLESSIMPADGLAPWSVRTSAGTVMTNFVSHVFIESLLDGSNFGTALTGYQWAVWYKTKFGSKIWPPNLVTICAWLPKLVVNVSCQFQHLVNTGLAVGFLVKWLAIMVAHTCKLDTIWVVYILPIGNGSIRL